ncbi:hypothetical protein A9Z42_0029230 [Trichoderma parareesei]|uniref:Uncharacterized protein n=1 Tax=Trichoderma parareesei TaxID=858221 RepID=A0A2H2ZKA0_TRIPA|nr:hypothetical protein A9Z42_0029230 [Trichoderma parareesei]
MGVTTAPSAPTQRQRRPRPTRPRTDEELAAREANRVRRWISRVREVRIRLTEEESRIYNGLSHHDGDGQVALVWRSGEWAVWRWGERLRALVEEELDVFAFLEVLCLMDCTIEETASHGRRRMTFQRE